MKKDEKLLNQEGQEIKATDEAVGTDDRAMSQAPAQPSKTIAEASQAVEIDLTDLQPYVGTKMVKAKAMTGEDFLGYSGRNMGTGPGMLIVYKDGFKSWCPAQVFHDAYAPTHHLTWALVESLLSKNVIATRSCWMVGGILKQVVCMQTQADIPLEVVPKMSSLNDEAKEYVLNFVQRDLKYRGQLLMITIDGYATTYTPDGLDRTATDWVVKGIDF